MPRSATLAEVEPGRVATPLVARVYDQNHLLVPHVNVRLEARVEENSGGHQHHDTNRPKGSLGGPPPTEHVITGNTGADGFTFTFTAPAVAGDHQIAASCTDRTCTQEGPDTVWVGYKDLQALSGSSSIYRLIGQKPEHPNNHYLTFTALNRITVLSVLYSAEYPDKAVLHLNDASLERGGFFDITLNWSGPHWEHCRGTTIDIRANGAEGALNITSYQDPMRFKFERLARKVGAEAIFDVPKDKNGIRQWELRHFHTRLMGQEGLQCP
jgi:hypothetical protein